MNDDKKTYNGKLPWKWVLPGMVFVTLGIWNDCRLIMAFDWECLRAKPTQISQLVANNFLVVGLGLAFLYAARWTRLDTQRKQAYPDEPWRWSGPWADGVVRCSPKAKVIARSLMALFLLGVFVPAIVEKASNPHTGRGEAWFNVIFFLLFFSVFIYVMKLPSSLRQWARQGDPSYFRLTTFPARIGGTLAGVLEFPDTWPASAITRVELCCIQRTGAGKTARYHTLWRTDSTGMAEADSISSLTLPVKFELPETAEPIKEDKGISWKLYAWSEKSPESFQVEFPMPVWPKA